jgi:hypothetical protein
MMAAWLWRIASGTKIPDRVFDSADKPRRGARFNSCACATEARRAQIQRRRTGGKFPRPDPERDRFSGAGEVRGADGADCCAETGSGRGIKRFEISRQSI